MPRGVHFSESWLAQRHASMVRDNGKAPTRPRLLAADLLPRIRKLADAEGWRGMDTYNALGPDHGLHVILVREAVIFADIRDEGDPITPSQQRWRDALNATGQVETYIWFPDDWKMICARLTTLCRPWPLKEHNHATALLPQ